MTIKMSYSEKMILESKLNEDDTLEKLLSIIILDSHFEELFEREFDSNAKALNAFLQKDAKIDFSYEYRTNVNLNVTVLSNKKLDSEELETEIECNNADNLYLNDCFNYVDCIVRAKISFVDDSVEFVSAKELRSA